VTSETLDDSTRGASSISTPVHVVYRLDRAIFVVHFEERMVKILAWPRRQRLCFRIETIQGEDED